MKNKIIVIVGPTAAGKSALALEIARRFNGEIVSCDSMQIYKYMNIGTAKPSEDEMKTVRHHMIDVADPASSEPFSCALFASMAKSAIDDIISRGKLPVLCGGTGLYIDSIVNETEFSDMENDPEYRKSLYNLAQENGNQYVHDMLKEIDPQSAENVHPNNLKRVIRALEIYRFTGKTKTEWDSISHTNESPYDSTVIGITYNHRENLYKRIDNRVDLMMEQGLLNEVKELCSKGFLPENSTAAQAIGYKELFSVIKGEQDVETAVSTIKQESRRLAKRQMTWFKRNKSIKWFYPDEITFDEKSATFEIIVNNVVDYLKSKGLCDII